MDQGEKKEEEEKPHQHVASVVTQCRIEGNPAKIKMVAKTRSKKKELLLEAKKHFAEDGVKEYVKDEADLLGWQQSEAEAGS